MTVKHISECYLKPKYNVNKSEELPHYLAPLDLLKLAFHYIQKGLLFTKPSKSNNLEPYSSHDFLESLKESLALTLVHFYPLAGQLVTRVDHTNHESLTFVDCNKGPGVKFMHATLNMTISDLLSPNDVPLVVHSLFDHPKAVGHDGHSISLLSVQVTELTDGVFIGLSANHTVLDGTSYWDFWNLWSEIHMSKDNHVAKLSQSIHERWFPDGYGPTNPVLLPFIHRDEFISFLEPPQLRVKFFHFSSNSIKALKSQANQQSNSSSIISSFQALSSHVWRSIIRVNRVSRSQSPNQATNLRLSVNIRPRLESSLPSDYFGNAIGVITVTKTVSELLEHDLGRTASLVNQAVIYHNDKTVMDSMKSWLENRKLVQHGAMYDADTILIASSPRFNMYGNEFGLGKAVAVRSGYGNKFENQVQAYPGCEGDGSVDLEICLPPYAMSALESDVEFMAAVTSKIVFVNIRNLQPLYL